MGPEGICLVDAVLVSLVAIFFLGYKYAGNATKKRRALLEPTNRFNDSKAACDDMYSRSSGDADIQKDATSNDSPIVFAGGFRPDAVVCYLNSVNTIANLPGKPTKNPHGRTPR